MRFSPSATAVLVAAVSSLAWAGPAVAAAPATSSGVRCTIVGTAGADRLRGTSGTDVICGLGGDDVISGGDGNDVIDGGPGNDTIDAGGGNDKIDAGAGNDQVRGGTGGDTVVAGAGDDTALGEAGNDKLDGGAGDDVIDGGPGADAIEGGTGVDTCTRDSADTSPKTSCTDLSAPVVVAATVRWNAKTYSNAAAQTVSVRLRVTDDRSGVSPNSLISMQSADGSVLLLSDPVLVSGTVNDGVWQLSGTLPQYAPSGVWRPFQVQMEDRVGHRSAVPAGFPSFTVTGLADTAAPVIDAASAVWNAPSFDNSQDHDLQLRVRITDDLSGVAGDGGMYVQSADGTTSLGLSPALVSGTPTDGVWQFTGVLPAGATTGDWHVYFTFVADKAGHRATVPAGLAGFAVTGTSDTQAPVVDVASVQWSPAVYDNGAERLLQVTMHVTDDVSGVSPGSGIFMTAPDGTVLGIGNATLLSGTPTDGVWQFQAPLPAYAPTGLWTASDVQLNDRVGHHSATPAGFPGFTVTAG